MKQIRWGILGAGRISSWFSTGLSVCEGAVKYAVGSRSAEKSQAFCRENGWSVAYGSYEAMLADYAVDLVYVATPHAMHGEQMLQCIQSGKAVLCEKRTALRPVAPTVDGRLIATDMEEG